MILISTAAGVISGMLIAHYLISSLFKRYYVPENRTIGKDIFHIIFSVFVIGVTNGAVIHSETDKVVLFYHGERLFKNDLEPKFFWKTNTEHIRTLEKTPDEAIKKIDQFFIC